MFAFWSSEPNPIPIKYRGLIKKTSHLKPIYLNFQILLQFFKVLELQELQVFLLCQEPQC